MHSLKEEIGVEAQAVQEDAPLYPCFLLDMLFLSCTSSALLTAAHFKEELESLPWLPEADEP